mgnify:CR=1 FL=1
MLFRSDQSGRQEFSAEINGGWAYTPVDTALLGIEGGSMRLDGDNPPFRIAKIDLESSTHEGHLDFGEKGGYFTRVSMRDGRSYFDKIDVVVIAEGDSFSSTVSFEPYSEAAQESFVTEYPESDWAAKIRSQS